jgi:enoyl-[acyl-carrier protein] reductase/trans-2-enoyl-CoA reductase (NAD+)
MMAGNGDLMIIEPKVRGFICTTAHPVGCHENVRRQVNYVKSMPKMDGPKKVLIIGASMGYGFASRISLAFASGAATIGVIFDRNGTGTGRVPAAGTIPPPSRISQPTRAFTPKR